MTIAFLGIGCGARKGEEAFIWNAFRRRGDDDRHITIDRI